MRITDYVADRAWLGLCCVCSERVGAVLGFGGRG